MLFLVVPTVVCVPTVTGQSAGDKIVITEAVEAKIGEKVVDKVFAGSIHTVVAIQDKWFALEGVKGWVARTNVLGLDAGRRFYERRARDKPQDVAAIATLGVIHYELGQFDDAISRLDESIKLNGGNAAVWNWRGIVMNAQRNNTTALRDFGNAIRLDPKFALAFHNRGLTYFDMGNYKDAVTDFDRAIELNDTRSDFFTHRGAAKHSNGDERGALADFDQAIKLNRRSVDAYIGKGNLFLGRDDYAKALGEVNIAHSLEPKNAKALNLRGWVLYKTGDLDAALADFDSAIEAAPDFPISLNNRGVLLTDQKKFAEAIKDFSRAIELESGVSIYYTNRANANFGNSEMTAAKADYEKAVELAPKLSDARNGLAWFLATCPDEALRDPSRAVEIAKAICEESKFKEWSHVDTYAAALAANSNLSEAVTNQESAVELAPEGKQGVCRERLELYRSGKPYRNSGPKESTRK